MSSNTVAEFANELKKSPETLLDQLKLLVWARLPLQTP
jgi:hypothetical protein